LETIKGADMFARKKKDGVLVVTEKADGTGKKDTLDKDTSLGELRAGKLTNAPSSSIGKYTVYFNDNSMEDL
jgi:hypothetical protein